MNNIAAVANTKHTNKVVPIESPASNEVLPLRSLNATYSPSKIEDISYSFVLRLLAAVSGSSHVLFTAESKTKGVVDSLYSPIYSSKVRLKPNELYSNAANKFKPNSLALGVSK